jgi:hypothetical protein
MQRERIAERDGWHCWLCGGAIDPSLSQGPWQATIDHLVPRSRGGGSDVANLRLAHRRCNNQRGSHLPEMAWPAEWQLLTSTPLWVALARLAPSPGRSEVIAVAPLLSSAQQAAEWAVERAEAFVPGGWESWVEITTQGPVSVWLRRPSTSPIGTAGRPRHPQPGDR